MSKKRGGGDRAIDEEMDGQKEAEGPCRGRHLSAAHPNSTCVVVLAPFATIDAQSASAGLGASWDIQERSFSPRFAARRDHGSARVALWEPACSCWYDAPHRTASNPRHVQLSVRRKGPILHCDAVSAHSNASAATGGGSSAYKHKHKQEASVYRRRGSFPAVAHSSR